MLGHDDKALREASSAEGLAKASFAETEAAEAEAAHWSKKVQEMKDRLRSAEADAEKSNQAVEEAKKAEKRAEDARAEAIRDKQRESEVSSEPAQERCMRDFASCTAGLVALQLEQWMAMLHINRFLVSLTTMAIAVGLLLLPARAQAASFAICTLVALPVLLAGAFREFLRFVATSPPSELLGTVAGLLTAMLAFAFLWQGADGLRLLLGAALAVLLGDLVLVASWLPLPEAMAALAACALGYAGAAAGLYRRRATQAFAMAVPAALLLPSGFLLFLEALGRSEAYLEDIISALLPWADEESEKVVGSSFCEYGRLVWLLLQLPAFANLLMAPGRDVPPFPWESEEPAEKSAVPDASPPEESNALEAIAPLSAMSDAGTDQHSSA
ncbi:unnamed protein product [Symbiodinium natans]|uniref:DUF4203 domain-containing protein n=1 Tax=Symbiodinium natans TaxID=878477 RepID=A0A812SJ66_9DINO|nr:unnamed protein product [Symbiodinium natans]